MEQLVICNDKFIIYEGDECATPGLAALVAVSANGYCAVERTYSNILKLEALALWRLLDHPLGSPHA